MRELFVRAINSQTAMPAKCCNLIPLHLAMKYLSKEEAAQYRLGFEEWNTESKDRIYCPNPRCSTFIPKRVVAAEAAETADAAPKTFTCPMPECATEICKDCKSYAHADLPCPQDTDRDAAVAQVMQWGYKQCPRCGHGIRKMFGCSHMVCLCGAHFCWVCQKGINECEDGGGCVDEEGSEYDYSDSEAEEATPAEPTPEAVQVEDTPQDVQVETLPLIQIDEPAPSIEETAVVIYPVPDNTNQPEALPARAEEPEQQTVETPLPPTTVEEQQPRRPRQPENLDRARPGFWEEQCLDFGEEPQGSDTTVWGCRHHWDNIDVKGLSVSIWERNDKDLKKSDEDVEPECHKCWRVIKESGWECSYCAVVFCQECKKKTGGDSTS
jgi:hypothetical protein